MTMRKSKSSSVLVLPSIPVFHGEVKIPLGAVWGLITGGHVIGAVEVRRDIGAIAEVELQTELDISIVVHKDVVAGGCVACADVCVVAGPAPSSVEL
jgi:hypothetical protein